jgi:uncharacterized damage-inducible protein DinB
MNASDIQLQYGYHRWANARTLQAVSKLTAEQYTKDLRSSHPSVRDTLIHMLWAERVWLCRWQGDSPQEMFDLADFPRLDSLKGKWAEVELEQSEFVEALTDDSLQNILSYVNLQGETWEYSLWQMMMQILSHSAYHRGQIPTMLRQLGAEPLMTDFLRFFDMKSERAR